MVSAETAVRVAETVDAATTVVQEEEAVEAAVGTGTCRSRTLYICNERNC